MALLQVVVTDIAEQGEGNRALTLAPLLGELPPFEAGAHVDVHLPGGVVRQYSIASAPDERDRHYVLCVKLAPASRGGSRHIHEQLVAGQRLWISLPRNHFPLQADGPHLLLAAGIGITPLLSMAQALDARGEAFVLHHYVRERAQAAFAGRLAQGFAHGRVQVHADAEGESPLTHVPDELAQPRGHLYLCGPGGFMDHFAALAGRAGWPAQNIHSERFDPVELVRADDAPFEVELASSGEVVEVPAGQSIAQALGEAGIPVEVSCEQGMCGACVTGVLAGVPDHRDCVLGAAEHAANDRMTLCCSRSRSPRLVLAL